MSVKIMHKQVPCMRLHCWNEFFKDINLFYSDRVSKIALALQPVVFVLPLRPSFCVSGCTSLKTTSPTTRRPPPSDRSWPWCLRGWWRRMRNSKVNVCIACPLVPRALWSAVLFIFYPLAAGLTEEPPAVQGNSNRRSVSTLRPSAKDAYMLFQVRRWIH